MVLLRCLLRPAATLVSRCALTGPAVACASSLGRCINRWLARNGIWEPCAGMGFCAVVSQMGVVEDWAANGVGDDVSDYCGLHHANVGTSPSTTMRPAMAG